MYVDMMYYIHSGGYNDLPEKNLPLLISFIARSHQFVVMVNVH